MFKFVRRNYVFLNLAGRNFIVGSFFGFRDQVTILVVYPDAKASRRGMLVARVFVLDVDAAGSDSGFDQLHVFVERDSLPAEMDRHDISAPRCDRQRNDQRGNRNDATNESREKVGPAHSHGITVKGSVGERLKSPGGDERLSMWIRPTSPLGCIFLVIGRFYVRPTFGQFLFSRDGVRANISSQMVDENTSPDCLAKLIYPIRRL